MNATIAMYWKDASTIGAKYERETHMVATQLAMLGAFIVEVFDEHNPKRRRYTSNLSARYLEKDLLHTPYVIPMTPAEERDFETLRNCLRYAESVFAEALSA